MPIWNDEYPHDLYANVYLYEGKIIRWRVGPTLRPPETVTWRGEIPIHKIGEGLITHEYKKWIVHDDKEHNAVFQKHATKWFKQWQMHENHRGGKPY